MSTTQDITDVPRDVVESIAAMFEQEYRDEIAEIYQHHPQKRSLVVDYSDVLTHDIHLADDLRQEPRRMIEAFSEAVEMVDIPIDVDISRLNIRPHNLPDEFRYYPGGFSPSEHAGELRAIEGEIVKATDTYAIHERTVFECQRDGQQTTILQQDGEFTEPHECPECGRQGPFEILQQQSEQLDGQKLRLQTPPDEAQGEGTDIDVLVRDDLAGRVTVGDRVVVTGIIDLEQQIQDNTRTNKFEPQVDGRHIEVEQTDASTLDINAEMRERIDDITNRGDPLGIAADSLAPKIYGHGMVKRAIILSLVGGAHVNYGGQDSDRGQVHTLLIGDPSTAKSKLVQRARDVGWRSVGVSGTNATVAGLTATAIQDDFGDGSWALDAGAAVKANRGVLAIDELDDMPGEVRDSLLEPMANQEINVNKGGINTTLSTRVAVIAAANPAQGRFDKHKPIPDQFDFGDTLLSRFDLVFTFQDIPDKEEDSAVAKHILDARDAAKNPECDGGALETSVEPETLRAWIALAKQQPTPCFASDEVKQQLKDSFIDIRTMYSDNEESPIPITFRNLEAAVRIAEAAARLELSETIEPHHADIATDMVDESMQQISRDPETGKLDADMIETGQSNTQRKRIEKVQEWMKSLTPEYNHGVPEEILLERADDHGFDETRMEHTIENLKDNAVIGEDPEEGLVWFGER